MVPGNSVVKMCVICVQSLSHIPISSLVALLIPFSNKIIRKYTLIKQSALNVMLQCVALTVNVYAVDPQLSNPTKSEYSEYKCMFY